MRPGARRGVLGPIDRLFRHGTAAGLTDAQLLDRFARRHDEAAEAAFAALVERHGPMVLGVCRGRLGDTPDAHDAFQATFLVLVRKAGSVRNRDGLAPWLYGVARRVSAHAGAASARRQAAEREAGSRLRTVDGGPPGPPVAELWDEVDRLPGPLRTAVVLCYLEGLTHDQAARRLGWPVGTVRSRLARARDTLRTRLTRRGLAPEAVVPWLSLPRFILPTPVAGPLARAALLAAPKDAAEAGLVSIAAAGLTEGVLRTMTLAATVKFALVPLALAATFAAGAGVLARAQDGPDQRPAPKPAPAMEPGGRLNMRWAVVPSASAPDRSLDVLRTLVLKAGDQIDRGDVAAAAETAAQIESVSRDWRRHLTGGARPAANSRPDVGRGPTPVDPNTSPKSPDSPETTKPPAPPVPPPPPSASVVTPLPTPGVPPVPFSDPVAVPLPSPGVPPVPPASPEAEPSGITRRQPGRVRQVDPPLDPSAMTRPPGRTAPAVPLFSPEDRLDELERKVDQILRALEKR